MSNRLLPWLYRVLLVVSGTAWLSAAGVPGAAEGSKIDFNRDIRPILSDHCFACHGPDEQKRKGGLRLDLKSEAFKQLKSGEHALVAGEPARSSLVARITTTDEEDVMPPRKGGKPLSAAQVALLTRWVKEGAVWSEHWSFVNPVRPPLPAVKDRRWARNEVDQFVLARMEKEGFAPNPEADKVTLVRRVTFDLTGLPPTVGEVDAFLADTAPDAYERVVQRLMNSPHYGERMALNWLDLARYADTSGYHFDGVRFMWLWRDWVIKSFNENLPYDQFTLEQLAGDLLPNPTVAQKIATGFVRNNMTNDEGGADPDEYLNKYVVDRVNTVGATWLGLTLGCTECHDHKYDPISTKEFYRLYAFFHNVPEKGLDRTRVDNPPPRLPVPTPEQARQFVEADFTLRDAEKTLQDRTNELGETQEKWERETLARPPAKPAGTGLLWSVGFEETLAAAPAGAGEGKRVGAAPSAEFVPGRVGKGLKLDGKTAIEYPAPAWGRTNAFTVSCWVKFDGDGAVASRMEKGPGFRGWDLLIADGRLQMHLIAAWPDDAIKVKTREQFTKGQWLHVLATYDGSSKAKGVKILVNGRARDLESEKDQLKGEILNEEPLRVGSRHGEAFLAGAIDEVRLFNGVAAVEDVRLQVFQDFLPLISKSRGNRSEEERADLQRFYREFYAVDYLRSQAAVDRARRAKEAFYSKIPSSMIMEEMEPPRDTFVLVRGDFRNPGEKVSAGTPAFLPPLGEGPANRLALARWIISPTHPLTARVTVNRYWAMFFGTGIVRTINDFGSQGEWPSHPELLDWLAVQFREGGTLHHRAGTGTRRVARAVRAWDVRELVRMIVTSATYRQSAVCEPAKLERDPNNRMLSRGVRLRLDAEFLRDNALAVSGLLNREVGGSSVKPYQPPGIWDGTDAAYVQDKGDLLYRRGMYVFWRRSAHYPSFATFDAPNREVCTFLRQRTQTPLQSLVLMNDPAFVEAARGLAQRVTREERGGVRQRIERAFRHVLGRVPKPEESRVLLQAYEDQLKAFQAAPKDAEAFLKVGELGRDSQVAPEELAALTAVANVLMNLNEAITK